MVSELSPATPWRRFMCIAYESILLFGVLFFFGYGFSALAQFKGQPGVVRWIFQGFIFLVLAVYFTWSWSEARQTLPMKTMSVRLVTDWGKPLGMVRALLRFICALGLLALGLAAGTWVHPGLYGLMVIPFAWTLADPQHRAMYDLLCGTRLIRS
ncbi:MAG: RDD family protein [Quisquiliibacterium sp.]